MNMNVEIEINKNQVEKLEEGVLYTNCECVFLYLPKVKNQYQDINAIILYDERRDTVPRYTLWTTLQGVSELNGKISLSNE